MAEIKILVRTKGPKGKMGAFKEATFVDLRGGRCQDNDGNVYRIVVTSPTGGVLRGDTNIAFKFPTE